MSKCVPVLRTLYNTLLKCGEDHLATKITRQVLGESAVDQLAVWCGAQVLLGCFVAVALPYTYFPGACATKVQPQGKSRRKIEFVKFAIGWESF